MYNTKFKEKKYMQYGLSLPNGGECADPRFLAELAPLAEEAGWDGIFLEDYICYQGSADAPTGDPWIALAAIATCTQRVRLGTSVTPLSRRRPWKVAREAVTLDQLSNGRLILGIGLGDSGERSFTHFGEVIDAKQRAEMLDECVDIIVGLWSGQPFSYKGKHYTIEEVTFTPMPVQSPRIPIWVGGGWPKKGPVQRAARWDGIVPYKVHSDTDESDLMPADIHALRETIAAHRNITTPFDIAVGGRERRDDWEQERTHIKAMSEAGITWWTEWIAPADRAHMLAAVRRGPLRVE